jgi:hypothetical protein
VNEISADQKRRIVEALEKAGVKLPCPRCTNDNFRLLDGYFNQPLQVELGGLVLGGPSVPSVVVVCTRCGYLSQHALGVLGLLPKEKREEAKK